MSIQLTAKDKKHLINMIIVLINIHLLILLASIGA